MLPHLPTIHFAVSISPPRLLGLPALLAAALRGHRRRRRPLSIAFLLPPPVDQITNPLVYAPLVLTEQGPSPAISPSPTASRPICASPAGRAVVGPRRRRPPSPTCGTAGEPLQGRSSQIALPLPSSCAGTSHSFLCRGPPTATAAPACTPPALLQVPHPDPSLSRMCSLWVYDCWYKWRPGAPLQLQQAILIVLVELLFEDIGVIRSNRVAW